jgi:hypothetical protein
MINKNMIAKLSSSSAIILLVATAILCGISKVQASSILKEAPLNITAITTVIVIVIIAVSTIVLLIMRQRKSVASLISPL